MEKKLRRQKRQLKRAVFFLKHRLIKKLFGDEEVKIETALIHAPTHDPKESNHLRVVRQRMTSGRLKANDNQA